MADKLIPGTRVLCVEQETGRAVPGFFKYSKSDIEAKLTAFDGFVYIPENQRITLLTEHLEFITLFQNIVRTGSRWKNSEPALNCDTLWIQSNLAVIGQCPWKEGMHVKQASFEVPHARRILENQKLKSQLSGEHWYKEAGRDLFRSKAGDVEVSVWYSASYTGGDDFPSEWTPRFDVRFDHPRPIDGFTDTLSLVSSFLSFCLGAQLSWDQVTVSNMDDVEIEMAIKTKDMFDYHQVIFLQSDFQPNMDGTGNWGSPCLCYDDGEARAFSECLAAWIERAPRWKTAYGLMMAYLRHRGTIGPDRLLNACKCLERIPGAESLGVVDNEDVQKVIEAAQNAASNLGHSHLSERLAFAIRRVGNEDHETRFQRLLSGLLGGRLIQREPSERMISDLKKAMHLRGHAAHSTLHANTDKEFQTLARAISAVECLCFLLLASDLPISQAGKERLHGNPIMSDYVNAY